MEILTILSSSAWVKRLAWTVEINSQANIIKQQI